MLPVQLGIRFGCRICIIQFMQWQDDVSVKLPSDTPVKQASCIPIPIENWNLQIRVSTKNSVDRIDGMRFDGSSRYSSEFDLHDWPAVSGTPPHRILAGLEI